MAGPSHKTKMTVGLLMVLAGAAFFVYFNALGNDFAYDDNVQIKKNPYITSFKYLNDIFTKNVWAFRGVEGISNYYRPMMTLPYLLNYQAFGLNPFGFHLTNILFHLMATLLVFLLGRRLLSNDLMAFMAALLFAVHPIHTESVTWVAGLTDVNCAVFFWRR